MRAVAATIAAGLGVAALISLGVWQLRRLAWKESLISAAETRAHAAPAPLPAPDVWSALKPADYEYRHVEASGVYDYAHQEFLFASLSEPRGKYGGVGYFVMTPMRLAGGATVVVNRGFVPDLLKDNAREGPQGETRVAGLMRASETRNPFTPADEVERGIFFARDVPALARAMGLASNAPFLIDADAGPEPLPEGGETQLTFVNNHLSYALTWFGLAAALIGVFATYVYGQARGR